MLNQKMQYQYMRDKTRFSNAAAISSPSYGTDTNKLRNNFFAFAKKITP